MASTFAHSDDLSANVGFEVDEKVSHMCTSLKYIYNIHVAIVTSTRQWSLSIYICLSRVCPSIKEEYDHIFVTLACSPIKWSLSIVSVWIVSIWIYTIHIHQTN